jgi:hypothetical protein
MDKPIVAAAGISQGKSEEHANGQYLLYIHTLFY